MASGAQAINLAELGGVPEAGEEVKEQQLQ